MRLALVHGLQLRYAQRAALRTVKRVVSAAERVSISAYLRKWQMVSRATRVCTGLVRRTAAAARLFDSSSLRFISETARARAGRSHACTVHSERIVEGATRTRAMHLLTAALLFTVHLGLLRGAPWFV